MDCDKCKKPLGKCKCPDIEERCDCENPDWSTSHDGVSLEEALGQPTLVDHLPKASHFRTVSSEKEFLEVDQKLKNKGVVVDDLSQAPPEVRETVERLNKLGIGVRVYRGTENELSPLLKGLNNPEEIKSDATEFDKMHYEAFTKAGGKLS